MDYKRQKPKAQRKPPTPLREVLASMPPQRETAWDIWVRMTPEQKAQLNDLGAQIDATMSLPAGTGRAAILDLAAHA